MTKWPRFGSKKAGLDDKGREWIKASGVTDWLELDDVEGDLWFVLVSVLLHATSGLRLLW